ncbi:MAG: MarR family transcriptional regulator [Enhydrobacter sp.]|nr:MarR family transcriptional regulator [Enhydrobacter sp.]
MSDAATRDKKDKKKDASPPVTAETFATVVSGLSRFLGRLPAYGPFRDSGIGLTEWILLNELANGPATGKKLCKDLGVTKQRVYQLTETLKKSGYLTVTESSTETRSKEGAGSNEFALSPTGKSELAAINERITPVLAKGLEGKERALHTATKSLKALTKLIAEPKSAEQLARKAGKKTSSGDDAA